VEMFFIHLHAMNAAHAIARSSLELKCHGKYICTLICLIIWGRDGKETVNLK
jgi:hypothetical protein